MLSNIIRVNLEKNGVSFEELEEFFPGNKLYTKGFKDSSVKLVLEHYYDSTLTLTLPREAIPNSFALGLLYSLYKGNALALPVILKYLAHRNLSDDFDKISQELQNKINQDIQVQNDSKTSEEIEICKQDILNVLNGGKSRLGGPLKKKYYSILENKVEKLKAEILTELKDYIKNNNTNILEIYQSFNSKIKKIKHYNKIVQPALCTSFIVLLLGAPFIVAVPVIGMVADYNTFLAVLMYMAAPFLVIITLALTIAGVAYLVKRNYEQSFAKEIEDFIEQPKCKEMQSHIKRPKCMDQATNTEDVKDLEQKETEVGNLIDFSPEPHQLKPVIDLLGNPPETVNTELDCVSLPSSTIQNGY